MKCTFLLFLFFSISSFGQTDHWETVVFETDNWDYLVPSSPVPSNWVNSGFIPTGWSAGPGGFGYGDGDDNTTIPNGSISCFQRIEFNISDTSDIEAMVLNIDYDDSFIAYLNGVEIARDLLSSGGQAAWNDLSTGLHEAQMYQGNYPNQYTLDKSFVTANLINGVNCLAVQVHNESNTSSDLSSRAFLHLGIKSTSLNYQPVPAWFVPPVVLSESNLPIVIINTLNSVNIPNEPKVAGMMGIINNGPGTINKITDPYNEFNGHIGIETRGSSSGGFAKKAYGLETRLIDSSNLNVSIFNWPADNDWILYAPYSDKSLIRNVLTYKVGNDLGRYAPRTKLCELVLNGEYMGVYVFMEKIKVNPGRVGVDKMDFTDVNSNEISGGYIVKIDKTTSGGIISWTSPYAAAPPATGPISYQLHDPAIDTINPLQEAYIENYITNFETALTGSNFTDPVLGYAPFIDVGSFIDFMIVNEISKNVDGYRISTFYHKHHVSDGGLLHAGPLWDFNLAWGNANYCEGGLTTGWEIYFNDVCGGGGSLNNPFHWNRLVQDPEFTHQLNCRWQELRMNELHTDSLLNYIDETHSYLADAADRNFTKWPVLGNYLWPNNFVGNTYQEEIDYLKTWTTDRLNWMDANMFGSCPDLSNPEQELSSFNVFPNPTSQNSTIRFENIIDNGKIELYDVSGKLLIDIEVINSNQAELEMQGHEAGIYFIKVYINSEQVGNEKLIKSL